MGCSGGKLTCTYLPPNHHRARERGWRKVICVLPYDNPVQCHMLFFLNVWKMSSLVDHW